MSPWCSLQAKLQPLSIKAVYPKLSMDPTTLQNYLANPPEGLAQPLWEQAKQDNPDPTKYVCMCVCVCVCVRACVRACVREKPTTKHVSMLCALAECLFCCFVSMENLFVRRMSLLVDFVFVCMVPC